MADCDAATEAAQRMALRRVRRDAARSASSGKDGIEFLSSQDGQIATENAINDKPDTIAARN